MENFSNQESAGSPIEVPRNLIRLIQEKGMSDPEVVADIEEWTKNQEKIVESLPRPEPEIRFTIARAELYLVGGDREGAVDCLEDALRQADQEGRPDLYQEILNKLKEVESSEM